jgi:uncharacterized DUF497 family protein
LRICTTVHTLLSVEYEWDDRKARSNLEKHGVDFADAVSILEDELALTIPDDEATERRFISIGEDSLRRILVVVFTERADRIRIISARKATKLEREQYEG